MLHGAKGAGPRRPRPLDLHRLFISTFFSFDMRRTGVRSQSFKEYHNGTESGCSHLLAACVKFSFIGHGMPACGYASECGFDRISPRL